MSEVEIIVTGKNLAKAAFASASADTDALKKRAADLALTLRRSELAAASAGSAAQRAFATAAAAADKAAASATAAAEAQDKLARGEISAEEAAKADAVAQEEAAKATDAAARAALAAERASVAQATAAKRAGEESAASADLAAAGSGRMAAGMEKLRSVGKAALEGLVVGVAAVGVESVKSAMKFDQAMELIHTQGGVAQSQIKQLSDGVLHLAGVVGQSPDSLAESLYHVESNFAGMGISADKALGLVKIAAEGARVGNANLVDVTNALTAAVASQIPGVGDLNHAMGVLNATVGSGDMKMQDLADAMGTGMVAVVKGYGLSITDVGAALAVFGDNNIRGAVAGTQLRMAVQALAVPAKAGAGALKELGMTSDQMAKDMQTGGLNKALTDLVDHMNKAGITAQQQGQIITELFGKKAGTGVAILVEQFARLQSKYKDLHQAGNSFASAWDDTQKQFSTAWAKMQDSVKALLIQLGERLIPIITKVIDWFNRHTTVTKVLAGAIGGVLLLAIGAYTASMIGAAAATIAATWPILAVVAAVGLLAAGLVYLYGHNKTFRDGVKKTWDEVKVAWDEAKKHWQLVVTAIMGPLGVLVVYFRQHTDELKKIWAAVWKELQKDWKSFENGPLKDIQNGLKNVEKWWKQNGADIVTAVKFYWRLVSTEIGVTLALIGGILKMALTMIKNEWRLAWGLVRDIAKLVWTVLADYIGSSIHAIHNIIAVVSDLITGRWGRLWSDVKRLVSQGLHDVIKTITDLTSNFGTLLWNAGKNVVQGLIDGINSMVGAVGSTMSNIVSTIRNYLPFSPAKVGPLSGDGSPDKAGAKITGMLAAGMLSTKQKAVDAMGSVMAGVRAGARPGVSDTPLVYDVPAARRPVDAGGGVRGSVSSGPRTVDTGGSAPGVAASGSAHHASHHRHHHKAAHDVDELKITLEWVGGHAGDEFFTWLKKNIRVRAGSGPNSVQKALGPG